MEVNWGILFGLMPTGSSLLGPRLHLLKGVGGHLTNPVGSKRIHRLNLMGGVLELELPLGLDLHAVQLALSRRLPRSDPVTETAPDLHLLLHDLSQLDQPRHAVDVNIQPDGAPAALIGALLDDGEGAGLIPPFLT